MKRKFTLLAAALMLLSCLAVPLGMRGQTVVTFTPGTDTGATSVTKGDITATMTTMNNSSYYQIYANQNGTFSTSSGKITKIEFTCTDSGTDKYGPGNASANVGSYTYSGTDGTWTGEAETVVISSTKQVRMTVLKITYTPATPSYTIIAQSNDLSYGTVELSGNVITASPKTNCRYASPAYTVTSGTATVSQSGNAFTVTPSSDCTVRINFEAIPTHTATFSVNGATTTQDFAEGATITFPSAPAAIQGKVFRGWVTEAIVETTDTEPSYVNTTTTTMGASDVTYYAVFATASGTAASLTKMTSSDTFVADDKVVIVASDNVAMYQATYNTTYVNKYTFDNNVATIAADNKKWFTVSAGSNGTWKLGDATNGYVYTSGSNNLAISTENSTAFTLAWNSTENKFTLVGNSRWLSYREDLSTQYFRLGGQTTGDPSGVVYFDIYKYIAGSLTYSNYCTTFEVYTITAESNNTEYGTVSLSGSVITGSPKTNCRYASPAYTVTSGAATVSQSGNDFTVTPSANTTVTINFELIPTYTLSSVVSPNVAAGTVDLGASSGLVEGATTTATATANAGYKFKNWSISGTGASLSSTTDNPTTVTIGTANATVTANFDPVTTYAITYSVNGKTNTVNVEENTAVDLSAPSSALIPIGYAFKGWRTSEISTPTDTEPTDYVTSATSTADITYYAVMAIESFNDATWTLDYANESDLSSSTSWGSYGTAYSYTASDGGAWTVKAYKSSGMQINNGKNCSIKVPTCSGYIQSIAITCSAAKAVGFSDSDYTGSGTITYVVYGTDATSQTLDFTGESKTDGYIVPKGGSTSITKIVVTYKVATYSNFCTSVPPITISEDVTIAGDLNVTYTLTVPSGNTLTVTGNLINTNPANLVIEDGGQLIINTPSAKTGSGVNATVKKEITGFGSVNSVQTGWYTIASPLISSITPADDMDYMLTNTYDLYYYDEAGIKWKNYKKNSFNLAPETGYLYANSSNKTLSFEGEVQYSDATITKTLSYDASNENVKGFNLVGNPFTCNITSTSNVTLAGSAFSAYYIADGTVSGGKNLIACNISERPIKPCEGFIVQATAASQNLVFNPSAKRGETAAKLSYVRIEAGNADFMDRAYVQFGNANTLRKLSIADNTAEVYVMQDDKDYAAATIEEINGQIPVCFKANTDGQYTITVNAEKVEMEYMHLIDNMTGADIDLLATPTYTFSAKTTDYASRFRLVFNANNGADEDGTSGSATFAFFNGSEWVISNTGRATLQVVDVTGRVLRSETVEGDATLSLNEVPGVYVMRLVKGESVKTQKIVVR